MIGGREDVIWECDNVRKGNEWAKGSVSNWKLKSVS